MTAFNYLLIAMILVIAAMAMYFVFKRDTNMDEKDKERFDIDFLTASIKNVFNEILNTNVAELNLNKVETLKREKIKLRLSKALRNCSFGNIGEKEYVKDYIKNLLQQLKINENNIDNVIPFNDASSLTIQDKFEILLYIYKKDHGGRAFEKMLEERNISEIKENDMGIHYEINSDDITNAYLENVPTLNFVDKLEIVAQRIYQNYKGHGVIDELRDQSCLDGISAGVSGLTSADYNYMDEVVENNLTEAAYRYDSVWIFFHGRTIHLSCLSFGTQKELERVCKNIYRYDAPYYLSGQKGYVITEDAAGSRIVVARPPFSESWKFWIRKFDNIKNFKIDKLLTDKNSDLPIKVMKYITRGGLVIAITGNQGSGKTTLLKALIAFIDQTFTLRIEEQVFETWLSKIYPKRNVATFRETATISMQEGMDFTKKTDGDCMILGEVASYGPAALAIQNSQVGTRQTMFTNHAKTVHKLIEYFRNALLSLGIFHDEKTAEEQVVKALGFDFHMEKAKDGHRYLERITEIIPLEIDDGFSPDLTMKEAFFRFFDKMTRKKTYETRDIVVFEKDRYILKNKISDEKMKIIKDCLNDDEIAEMEQLFATLN